MESEVLFSERQQNKPWWLWLFLLATDGLLLFVAYNEAFATPPSHNSGGLVVFGIWWLVSALILVGFRMDTQIRQDGIYIRHFPFHLVFEKYAWGDISKAYLRQYNPIGDFGGYGWARQFGSESSLGMAFIVSGNEGLQLVLTDGTKLLIGTQKSAELKDVLVALGQHA